MTPLRICSPHCGVSPETISGGETYERELLTRLGRDGVRLEIILARGKSSGRLPHFLCIASASSASCAVGGAVTSCPLPSGACRHDRLRPAARHALRFIGPPACSRRLRLYVPVVALYHLDPDHRPADREAGGERLRPSRVRSEFARRRVAESLVIVSTTWVGAVRRRSAGSLPSARRDLLGGMVGDWPVALFFGVSSLAEPPILLECVGDVLVPGRAPASVRVWRTAGATARRRAATAALCDRVTFTARAGVGEGRPLHPGDVFVFLRVDGSDGIGRRFLVPVGRRSDRGSIPQLSSPRAVSSSDRRSAASGGAVTLLRDPALRAAGPPMPSALTAVRWGPLRGALARDR